MSQVVSHLHLQRNRLRLLQAEFFKLNDQITHLEQVYLDLLDRNQQLLATRQNIHLQQQHRAEKSMIEEESERMRLQKLLEYNQRLVSDNQRMCDLNMQYQNKIQEVDRLSNELYPKLQHLQADRTAFALKTKELHLETADLLHSLRQTQLSLDEQRLVLWTQKKQRQSSEETMVRLQQGEMRGLSDREQLERQIKAGNEKIEMLQLQLKELNQTLETKTAQLTMIGQFVYSQQVQLSRNRQLFEQETHAVSQLSEELLRVQSVVGSLQRELRGLYEGEERLQERGFEVRDESRRIKEEIDNCNKLIGQFQALQGR